MSDDRSKDLIIQIRKALFVSVRGAATKPVSWAVAFLIMCLGISSVAITTGEFPMKVGRGIANAFGVPGVSE
ncbi:MAG: hypothetical protein QOD40_760 [Alphaproteobacteria bacterium]|jgi:hypothetical protein|nr:hypothetical protein [Alphaproteobacteria bacterium]